MAEEKLSKDKLETAEAVLSLGLVVVRELQERGIVSVFINSDGEVEIIPPGELELDLLPQENALDSLIDRGYEDEQLLAYLKGRKARRTSNGQDL